MHELTSRLQDPVSGLRMGPETVGSGLFGPRLLGTPAASLGPTERVLSIEGEPAGYPIVDGIPVLMRTERLSPTPEDVQVGGTHFAESYQEQKLYASLANSTLGTRSLAEVRRVVELAEPAAFPEPAQHWFGGGTTGAAYMSAMRWLAPVADQVVLQIGGVGTHALKLLHAGASFALVVSPVVQELVVGQAIAQQLGLDNRVAFVGGVAEELPIADSCVDRIYSGSSLHHTNTMRAMPELQRVLGTDGRWATVDVWKSSFHSAGTRMFGKCHGNPYCHPLDDERISPVFAAFPDAQAEFFGGSLRYGLAVAERVGLRANACQGMRLAKVEERIPLGRLERRLSSLVCLTGSQLAGL
jgi:hypothetical protein